jgi:hypothetical protein
LRSVVSICNKIPAATQSRPTLAGSEGELIDIEP